MPNQRGVTQIAILFILGLGLVVGYYLVNYTQTNLKPKAFELNPGTRLMQVDNPPPLMIKNTQNIQNLLSDSVDTIGYELELTKTEDKVTIDFTPTEELTEERAKEMLALSNNYYLRMLTWVLTDPFNSVDGLGIDPWYALCDHLSDEKLAEIGVEQTTLKYGKLTCFDNPPTKDQFIVGDSHSQFEYRKIPATTLIRMVETARIQRESKSLTENSKDLAFSMIPILGPLINAHRNPGADPSQVSQATVVNSLMNVLTVGFGSTLSSGGSALLQPVTSKFSGNSVIVVLGQTTAQLSDDLLAGIINFATSHMNNRQPLSMSLVNEK